MCVCHRCDNPKCVNPEHLFLGTPKDNITDRKSKNRQAKGSQIGNSKLNEANVLEIKRLLAETNLTQEEIAKLFGVDGVACAQRNQATISNIKKGKKWAHVLGASQKSDE
jgi:predicted XRE-type DNA-binding protein